MLTTEVHTMLTTVVHTMLTTVALTLLCGSFKPPGSNRRMDAFVCEEGKMDR